MKLDLTEVKASKPLGRSARKGTTMQPLKPKQKRAPETVGISFRLPLELHEAFERLTENAGVTWSEALRQLIQEYVEKFG